ncbi:MAG: transposase [Acetobacteraceae bacterium]|nr:transposase [Acetobacteraceae bacterium]
MRRDSKLIFMREISGDSRPSDRRGMVVLRAVCDRDRAAARAAAAGPSPRAGAVFWIARTGAPWRDLPEELGNWNSVHRQFRRSTASGLWDLMLSALAEGGGSDGLQMVDSTIVRAHHCAAGAKGGLRTRLLAARAAGSRPKSTFGPTLRVFRSLSC